MNISTSLAISNAIKAAYSSDSQEIDDDQSMPDILDLRDKEVSPLFGLIPIFLVFVVMPAIAFGIMWLLS